MVNFWLNAGLEVARLLIPVLIGGLLYRKFVSPSINEALGDIQEAHASITNLAKLAGVKSQEYAASKTIEKSVARDIIQERIPELEAFKMFLSPATWDEIQDTIDNNPEAILQLYDKYKHLLPGNMQPQEQKIETDF